MDNRTNSFLESLKVDQETINRCNDVSRNVAQKANSSKAKYSSDDGGREHGDSGPGSLGRESGNKTGGETMSHEGSSSGHVSEGGQSSVNNSGHSANCQGGSTGHGTSGQGGGH